MRADSLFGHDAELDHTISPGGKCKFDMLADSNSRFRFEIFIWVGIRDC